MKHTKRLFLTIVAVSLFSVGGPPDAFTFAQGGDGACPAIVEMALETASESCNGLGRNEACYGHDRIDAIFWEEGDELVFSAPADMVPLLELQTLATAPLNVEEELWGVATLHVQANVPDTLPGQGVTFLLMGDTTLENAVTPDEVAGEVTPVVATATAGANLRSRPTTNANVVGSVAVGAELMLLGVNDGGDWYEFAFESGANAWIFGDLVAVEDDDALAELPVTAGADMPPRYGPMQAFYLNTGFGAPLCHEAPNALVVQSPDGVEVTLNINEMEVQLGSTVVFTVVELPEETSSLGMMRPMKQGTPSTGLATVLVDGNANVGGYNLSQSGQAILMPLAGGRVPDGAMPLPIPDGALDHITTTAHYAIGNAASDGFLPTNGFGGFMDTPIVPWMPPIIPPPPPSDGQPDDHGNGCTDGQPSDGPADGSTDGQTGDGQAQPPQITHPASGTELRGGGSHPLEWQGGTPPYTVEITGDSGNASGFAGASYSTGFNSMPLDLNALPMRKAGWGYNVRVTDANGNSAEIWIVRRGDPSAPGDPGPCPDPSTSSSS